MEKLLYEDLYTREDKKTFLEGVRRISQELLIKPDWLMAIMKFESGLNPSAQNRFSKATGLIQFMPATARGLGTTIEALQKMSGTEQLEYVKKYFTGANGRIKNFYDLYLYTFYPVALSWEDSRQFPEKDVQSNQKVFIYGNTKGAWKKFIYKTFEKDGPEAVKRLFE